MNTSFETMVRTYKNTDDYQKDQKKLAKDGWSTQAMVERKPRAGVGRIVTLGMASVIRPPKPELVITYQRAIAVPVPKAQKVKDAPKVSVSCPKCGQVLSDKAYFCTNCGLAIRR